MKIITSINEMRSYISNKTNASIGLVPTMGYFHDGHLSLMKQARIDNDIVVVSLFVNPIQFGPKEDLKSYPRDIDRDAKMAEDTGVDIIFTPDASEMYPNDYCTYIDVLNITDSLCGASRPGHFRGVATVLTKLFNIVQPSHAYFGMKDYQQLRVVQQMVKDLNIPTEIVSMPTYREPDGLAMSSRNTYLNAEERKAALVLSKSLEYAQQQLNKGCNSAEDLKSKVENFILAEPLANIDYVSIVDDKSLNGIIEVKDTALLALAVKIGKTRLIDNTILKNSK